MPHHARAVENYTSAFLASFGLILFMLFWVIAALAGFVWVVLSAVVIDHLGRWVGARLAHRAGCGT